MPQLVQVLKCFKCFVFQVHQTKKSNKWECKLCGEKQSIKRHYGLGTAKECRLHVQKLNCIRGQSEEINELVNPNESSDDEVPAKDDTCVPNKKRVNILKSKWSEFVDKTEDAKEPEPESMYIENAEVVLEVPAKQRKFAKHKLIKNASISSTYPRKTNCFDYIQGTPISNVKKNLHDITDASITTSKTDEDQVFKVMSRQTEFQEPKTRAENQTLVSHKVDKNSKWAQYADESEEETHCCEEDLSSQSRNDENATNNDNTVDLELRKDENREKAPKDLPKNIFSLCDEDDLDDVLHFKDQSLSE